MGGWGGGQHWVTPLQIRPTTATVIHTSKPSKPTAQSLLSVYAHAPFPSHAEPSVSAQQQALLTQLLSDGSTLIKGHRTASTHSKACFLIPPLGCQCRATSQLFRQGMARFKSDSLPPSDPCSALMLQSCPQRLHRKHEASHPIRGGRWGQGSS